MASHGPVLEARGLAKGFTAGEGRVEALREASLRILPGEVHAILGVSGSGKTTLLHCLGLIERPDGGSLRIEGTELQSAPESSLAAYKMAGMGPREMELAMIYDSFTITAAITAEMLGLAKRGEGHLLWEGGKAGPGGSGIPVNTNGGGLSFSHSGMYGMMLLVEAYRQLSGTAEDGVNGLPGKQTNAKTAIVNGTGGSLSVTANLVLVADD